MCYTSRDVIFISLAEKANTSPPWQETGEKKKKKSKNKKNLNIAISPKQVLR